MDAAHLLDASRRGQGRLFRGIAWFLLRNLHQSAVRNSGLFQEWFHCPMNYARIMELPLTMLFLEADRSDRILDISSPKLLSACYGRWGFRHLVAADVEDYFIRDFEVYRELCNLQLATSLFDATKAIPFPEGHFDKAFSVSVLEHIPADGDRRALSEITRVLRDDGRLVITLPAFPEYVEEWVSPHRTPYWQKATANAEGRVFYQRRYDSDALYERLSVDGARIEETILIAEKPVDKPRLSDDGMMLHNSYYIDRVRMARLLRTIGRRIGRLPFMDYMAESLVSRKCHYLTSDWSDPNIRQVVVSIRKQHLAKKPAAGSVPPRA